MAFGFYSDAGMTIPLVKLVFQQASDGSAAPDDAVAYFGDPVSGRKVQANSDPGVDPVYVTLSDALPASGLSPSMVKLALSSGGLSSALAGEPVALGTSVLSGVGNAVAIHARVDTPALAVGLYSDLGLVMPELLESAV